MPARSLKDCRLARSSRLVGAPAGPEKAHGLSAGGGHTTRAVASPLSVHFCAAILTVTCWLSIVRNFFLTVWLGLP